MNADTTSKIETYPIDNRDQWLARRQLDVTASDVGAVAGVNPYRSPARVYYEKMGLIPGIEDNAMMRQGRWFEPAIKVALSEERSSWAVSKCSIYLRDPERRIGCTPDFVAVDPERDGQGLLQGKVVERSVYDANWFEDGVLAAPLSYQLQTLVEAKLTGASWAALAVLVHASFGKSELQVIPVNIHDGAWQVVCDAVASFWKNVANGVEPSLDPRRDEELVKQLWPEDNSLTIDLPESVCTTVDMLERAKAELKLIEAEKAELETSLKMAMGANSCGRLPDGRSVSWRQQHKGAFYMPEVDFRVLRLHKAKGRALRRGAA